MGPIPTHLVSLREQEIRTQTCTEGRPCEDTGGAGRLQANERALRRNQPCSHLDLGLPDFRTVRKYISVI